MEKIKEISNRNKQKERNSVIKKRGSLKKRFGVAS
jgi:hypothetical protein